MVRSHGTGFQTFSRFQSKSGSTTTDFGMKGALSRSSNVLSSWVSSLYPKTAGSHFSSPIVARAYGSSSSLLGLKRWPSSGLYEPWTRKP